MRCLGVADRRVVQQYDVVYTLLGIIPRPRAELPCWIRAGFLVVMQPTLFKAFDLQQLTANSRRLFPR